MALIFMDGFDAYPSSDLTSKYNVRTGGFVILPGQGRFSSGAVGQATAGGGGELIAKFFQGRQTLIVGVAYKFSYSAAGSFPTLVISLNDLGAAQVQLWLNGSQILEIRNASGTVLATGTHTLFQNTFYYLEFKVTIGSSGHAEARIGGVTECSFTGNTDSQGVGRVSGIGLHYDHFRVPGSFDDLYVADSTGIRNNDFIGDVRVETRLATGQGDSSDFSVTGSGTHYGAVSESAQDGDTSYISSSSVGAKDSFTLPPLSSTPLFIAGIQQTTVARKDDAGIRTLAAYLKISGADYVNGINIPLTDSYTYDSSLLENNPATGAAWTRDELEAAQIGIKLTG